MDKEIIVFSAYLIVFIIFIALSILINKLVFIKKIKMKNYIKNFIFGILIFLLGIFLLYLSYNKEFRSNGLNLIKYFIPVYIITTGFTIVLMGYLDNNNQ